MRSASLDEMRSTAKSVQELFSKEFNDRQDRMINEIQQRHLKEEVDCSLEYAYHLAHVGNPLDGVRSTGEDDEKARSIFLDLVRLRNRFDEKMIQEKARTAQMFLRHLLPEEKE